MSDTNRRFLFQETNLVGGAGCLLSDVGLNT